MSKHLQGQFTVQEVTELLERYLAGELGSKEAMALLQLKRSQFFGLLKRYRDKSGAFNLSTMRQVSTRQLPMVVHQKILLELAEEKKLIDNKNIPVSFYNYSYIKNRLATEFNVKVSLPSIITRAKKMVIINLGQRVNVMIVKC